MPLYEYSCDQCGHQFADFRSIAEREAPNECPECGGAAHLQLSACAVVTPGGRPGGGGHRCAPGGG